jgi:ADP-glucose pyrophosphorylase
MARDGCRVIHSFEETADGAGTELAERFDGVWTCPRETVADTDHCAFHLPEAVRQDHDISDDELSARFAAELEGRTGVPPDRRGELVAVEMGSLCLEGVTVSADYPISLVDATVDRLVLADGTVTDLPIKVSGGAVVRQSVEVRGRETTVEGVTVDHGGEVGVDGVGLPDARGLRVVDGASVESTVSVRDHGTKVGRVEFDDARADVLRVQREAGVLEGVNVADATLERVVLRETEGSPVLGIEGRDARVDAVTVERTDLDQLTVAGGATVSEEVALFGPAVVHGPLTVTGDGTVVDELALDGVSVGAVCRTTDGATVDMLSVADTSIVLDPHVDEAGALVVRDEGTVVSTVSVRDDTVVDGLVTQDGATVGSLCAADATVWPLVVDEATVTERLEVREATEVSQPPEGDPPSVELVDARVASLAVSGGTLPGPVTLSEDTTVSGDVALTPSENGPIEVHAAVGVAVSNATVEGTVQLDGPFEGADTALQVTDATLGGGFTVTRGSVEGDTVVEGSLVSSDVRVEDGATVNGTVTLAEGTRVEGTLVLDSSEVAGLAVNAATIERGLSIIGDTTVQSSAELRRESEDADTALQVTDATLGGGLIVTGGSVEGDTVVEGSLVSSDVRVEDGATVDGTVTLTQATRVEGTLVVSSSEVEGLAVNAATVDRGVSIVDDTTVHGSAELRRESGGVDTALWVTDATLGGGFIVTAGSVEGELLLEGSLVSSDVRVEDGTTVDGTVTLTEGTRVEGALVVDGSEVEGLIVTAATVERGLSIVGGTTVHGSAELLRDTQFGGDIVVGVAPDADAVPAVTDDDSELSGETTGSEGATDSVGETRVEGRLVLGGVAGDHPTAGGVSVSGSIALVGTTAVEDGLRLVDTVVDGDIAVSDVPELGILDLQDATVDGKLVVAGSDVGDPEADDPAIVLEESAVGEDVRVVDGADRSETGKIDLLDTIVDGKVRVDRAAVAGLRLTECRVGESVWFGPTRRAREDGAERVSVSRTVVSGAITVRATPVAENVVIRGGTLGRFALEDAIIEGRVDVTHADVGELTLGGTHVGERFALSSSRVDGIAVADSAVDGSVELLPSRSDDNSASSDHHPDTILPDGLHQVPTDDLWIPGSLDLSGIRVGDTLTVDCAVGSADRSDDPMSLEDATVDGSVSIRPRLYGHDCVDIEGALLPAGELHVTETTDSARDYVWYDITGATVGDVDITVPDGAGMAVDHLRVLQTEFDGFRFGGLDGDVTTSNTRLHRVSNVDVPEPGTRDETGRDPGDVRARVRDLFATLTRAGARLFPTGTGYEPGDPPAWRLERTYLNAKNGASQTGDEHIAGYFFTREKRYRRRSHWEQLCLPDRDSEAGESDAARDGDRPAGRDASPDGSANWLRTLWRWASNATLDLVAVYGESSRRVVGFSTVVVGVFALVFGLLLDELPYGDQYLGPGILPEWFARLIQPLTLSIESFVTLVLVGPADQRLTPFVHLLGQIEGFFGVFLVALFVFTLTRSIHR